MGLKKRPIAEVLKKSNKDLTLRGGSVSGPGNLVRIDIIINAEKYK